MKLEMIGTVKNFTEKSQLADIVRPVLREGDILICQVEGKQGNTVLFKDQHDGFFMAKLQGAIAIETGDNVEMIVSSTENAQYVLKVIDIAPKSIAQPAITDEESLSAGSLPVQEGKGNIKILTTALTIIKQNPNIQPKLALFLAANHISALPENVEALTQMLKGDTKMGTVLAEILNGIQEQPGEMATKHTFADQKSQIIAQLTDVDSDKRTINRTMDVDSDKRTTNRSTENNISDNQSSISRMGTKSTPAAQMYEAPKMGETFADSTQKQIIDQILVMFCIPDHEKNGAAIKKKVLEIPEKLKELKILIKHNDNKNKEVYIQKADQLEQQMKLMSQIKRVTCFQIPIYLKDQTKQTAELFVYRHKNKKTMAGTDNISILIGLDTQYIGRVEVLIKARNRDVSLQFGMEKDEMLHTIDQSENRLAEVIDKAGYRLTDIKTKVLEEKTTVLNAEDVLACEAETARENIDVRI